VLQEFFVVATKKLGVDPLDAKGILESFENFEVVQITPHLIRSAIDTSVLNRLSFWDALIVAAAESAACELLVTEDLSDGQVIRGVRVTNPFG
jgi:predicted nucleic acid-binding protein